MPEPGGGRTDARGATDDAAVRTREQQRRESGARAELAVARSLTATLPEGSVVLRNVNLVVDGEQSEADVLAVVPGLGLAVVEVKSGNVRLTDGEWRQGGRAIDPVRQARRTMHAARRYLHERDAVTFRRLRATYLLALPGSRIPETFRAPDVTRRMILDSGDLLEGRAGERLVAALTRDADGDRVPDAALVATISASFAPSLPGQADLLAAAEEQDLLAEQLTADQARVLDLARAMPRLQIVGGAGSGKTWLALEQARRLSAQGRRVALLCYSRGLGRYLQRTTSAWRRERPAWVGLFHELPVEWGATPGRDDDPEDWETRLPRDLATLATTRDPADLFDAIVVDEAQDFGDEWWPALLRCLRDPGTGGLTVFSDESQRVFARDGRAPIELATLTLEENLRSTREIARTFGSYGDGVVRPAGAHGAPVRLVEAGDAEAIASDDRALRRAAADEVLAAADDAVEALVEEGWNPGDIALLCTGSRHPEQVNTVELRGHTAYWDDALDGVDVFYGHVLNFKGLERRVVVLAVNGVRDLDRARHMLYTGMSRARSLLVVVGPRAFVERVGGEAAVHRLREATPWPVRVCD
ncbi:MAG TPA: NERD nuclease [Micrococcales bacterium]|uniref:nuclease-related domain-containing DEAD/DEAH box helicase n=1 Tax=Miniimonas arenae TaxID=676201 RepID=UPI000EEE0590|nr:NERD domain-containing protein [Miniimonas arenae]HCX83654.1 NERD nuclease [Micrococcales bacterium]